MTRPSRPSSSSGLRTSTTSAPSRRSIAACSRKLPCTARTPIRSGSMGRNGIGGLLLSLRDKAERKACTCAPAKLGRMGGLGVFLALASSATWGVADFSGGLLARRIATIALTVLSQAAGFVALLVALAIAGGALDGRSLALGLVAGIGGGTGLAAFYKALSLGTMSIVSPLVA